MYPHKTQGTRLGYRINLTQRSPLGDFDNRFMVSGCGSHGVGLESYEVMPRLGRMYETTAILCMFFPACLLNSGETSN